MSLRIFSKHLIVNYGDMKRRKLSAVFIVGLFDCSLGIQPKWKTVDVMSLVWFTMGLTAIWPFTI